MGWFADCGLSSPYEAGECRGWLACSYVLSELYSLSCIEITMSYKLALCSWEDCVQCRIHTIKYSRWYLLIVVILC